MTDIAQEFKNMSSAIGLLEIRYLACYMLSDWCIAHAERAAANLKIMLEQEVNELLQTDVVTINVYSKMLAGKIEDFIQTHISDWAGERAIVEVEIAKLMAAILLGKSDAEINAMR